MIGNAFFVVKISPNEFFKVITADTFSEHLNLVMKTQLELSDFKSLKRDLV